ncbi:glycosyl transferase [Coniochaeta sp. 2T2.1]|nr:glycosyl transferase [Coniochaeta sp. 2T2.1]
MLGVGVHDTVDLLMKLYEGSNVHGLVLRPLRPNGADDVGSKWFNSLVEQLTERRIPVLAICHHDDKSLPRIKLGLIDGLIIENACILETGKRRDFFRSTMLRHMVARCWEQQTTRPSFFLGLLDIWDCQPSPAVVRRAFRIAAHFGAHYEHGSTEAPPAGVHSPASLSGLEYLRRDEVLGLQKAWNNQERKVHMGSSTLDFSGSDVASLDLGELGRVIPGVRTLLRAQPLSEELLVATAKLPLLVDPPPYVDFLPHAADFWGVSCNNEPFVPFGCFPIITGACENEYSGVVETQTHLRDLNMLERLGDAEVEGLLRQLRAFQAVSHHPHAVAGLVDCLVSRTVTIFRGLSTGFRVPDTAVEFWGVSIDNENCLDIHISKQAPSVVGTVLHVWLAANHVSRSTRFEEEARLELLMGNSSTHATGLPTSIRVELERATPGELLFLLQRLRLVTMDRSLTGIQEFCERVLLDATDDSAWTNAHCRRYWEGSVDMAQLLQSRLERFARGGVAELPTLDNLLQLQHHVEELVNQALFAADRGRLDVLTDVLLHCYDPWTTWSTCEYVDVNADLFALLFFTALRRTALDDVYIEATDRCPFFLSQPDQAAVFAELWSVGSQTHGYFGMLPSDLGGIIFNRYQSYLEENPPPVSITDCCGRTCYASPSEVVESERARAGKQAEGQRPNTPYYGGHDQILRQWKVRAHDFGALSIFCMPAVVDVVLLTFIGRGVFVTAYMDRDFLAMGCYALLTSLLLAAGVTGWVGSIGSYYISHYAYDNMILFHVQRLSGGFVLSVICSLVGLASFSVTYSIAAGFVFVAYMMGVSLYLYTMGILATMHQRGSPLTSGRTVLWRTIPMLLISPLLSSLVNGHDLKIYLPVIYGFLVVILVQYRNLCHEWSAWLSKVPTLQQSDIEEWYSAKLQDPSTGSTTSPDEDAIVGEPLRMLAVKAFQQSVQAQPQRRPPASGSDPFVRNIARSLPYAQWLLQKGHQENDAVPEVFSSTWFAELQLAMKAQQQLSRGLKEQSAFMLFRFARYDLGQNVALFMLCLLDRWVDTFTGAGGANATIFIDRRARYGIGLAILYFCTAVMAVDATLYPYWQDGSKMSDEKLTDPSCARQVQRRWERQVSTSLLIRRALLTNGFRRRRMRYLHALGHLSKKLSLILGFYTILLWLFVENPKSILLYWLYILGYTGVIIFQFNRCFTTDVRAHLTVTYLSAIAGLTAGCILQASPATSSSMFNNVLALDIATVLTACLTSVWVVFDFGRSKIDNASGDTQTGGQSRQKRLGNGVQSHVTAPEPSCELHIQGIVQITSASSVELAQRITLLLKRSLECPNGYARAASWSKVLLSRALEAWLRGDVAINVVNRSDMVRHGHGGSHSFCVWDAGVLHITAGFLEEAEIMSVQWQELLAELLCESLLHHSTRALLKYGNSHAVQAEHFLSSTEYLSSRIYLEIATISATELSAIQRKTVSEVLRHLCLNVDVDCCWENLAPASRRAIVCRVMGRQVPLCTEFGSWMEDAHIDQQTTDFHLDLSIEIYQRSLQRLQVPISDSPSRFSPCLESERVRLLAALDTRRSLLRAFWSFLTHVAVAAAKWIAIITGAASDVERELYFCLRTWFLRDKLLLVFLTAWKMCWHVKNAWVYMLLIYHRSALAHISRLAHRGASRVLKRNIITVEFPRKVLTGFASGNDQGTMTLQIFHGRLDVPPPGIQPSAVAVYDEYFRLKSRTDDTGTGTRSSSYEYEGGHTRRWPQRKHVVQDSTSIRGHYDAMGRISHGTLTLGTNSFVFQYRYKTGEKKDSSYILAADYRPAGSDSGNRMTVYWGSPPKGDFPHKWTKCDWVPSDKLCCVMRFIDGKTYVTTWEYLHRRDPIITAYLHDGDMKTVVTNVPSVFAEEQELLARPTHVNFDDDDLLVHHRLTDLRLAARVTSKESFASMLNPLRWTYGLQKARYRPVPTWWLRSELWNHWLTVRDVDAVTACWMDHVILREEPLLKAYWRARDIGRLDRAKKALDANIEQIVAAIEIEREVSEMCLLPTKASDLYAMGQSKDANQINNRPQDCFLDTDNRISVIFNDIGCWPDAPGGVSNCRRDLLNGHSTIRNHVLAETANDYGIPRFQVEKSIQSLKLLPLWGIDGKTPNHGIIDNLLQSQVDDKIRKTDSHRDIVQTFVPLLRLFVEGARNRAPSKNQLRQYSQVFIALSKYFEDKDYNQTWQSKEVMGAWVEAWLAPYHDAAMRDPASLFEIERPSMKDFQDALAIYSSYLFIISVQVPEECPRVFQSTHHGISSLFGAILKYRRGVTFGIWDHAILWRECCLNVSPAQSSLSIPVQSMLLAGIRMATRLAYLHADVLLPCTSAFNPVWEADLGTDSGRLMHRKLFSRKIDPIVNGISNVESFNLTDRVESKTPTVVMLSNVQLIKDIKTALVAADIIVNKFGFREYRLLVYGALDRQPSYVTEMNKLITGYNISEHVSLAGFASPHEVLRSAWVFMNSSISEGLPLAIGEAALAGIPIVATEVGSTALVLTDPDDATMRYGEVVPPNDPMALARAQISILAMVGPWSQFTRDAIAPSSSIKRTSRYPTVLPESLTTLDVDWITRRMYEYVDDRRRLGLRGRDVVLRSFHGKRYLREHEQMYWIQWHIAKMRAARGQIVLRCLEDSEDKANLV